MTDHIVLILAAGKSDRWGGKPKQLLPLWDGETVLSRMVRQIQKAGFAPVVVTCDGRIAKAAPDSYLPERSGSIYETFLSTALLWDRQTSVLLGDVVFTDQAMGRVLAEKGWFRVFGNDKETYALSFPEVDHAALVKALGAEIEIGLAGGVGSLRRMRFAIPHSHWDWIGDITDDVDSPDKMNLIRVAWNRMETS